MSTLDDKINAQFPGLVVRKDLVKTVKGNAIVPSYVLEYLLGQYCATNDEASIQSGIATVKEILAKHYVHRNEAGLVRSNIRERGRYKVIDKIAVALNDKLDVYEATFSNLGIKDVLVDTDTVKAHPKLLVSGVWCIADLEYEHSEDSRVSPWILSTLKPIQLSQFDFPAYLDARKAFTTEEWIDLLVQSMGFNPEMFGHRGKLFQLLRLVPFVERNYNLIELGPKGTGKSHIFSEFSPHGMLLSGGEVTVPKLFVNNQNGKIGLVGYWDVVAFDEFAGKQKRVDKALVDILKNYMANKTFSRGIETLGAEASMVFVGNTRHNVPYMLKHSDLFDELPDKFHDSAFIDRLHAYLPGWEVDVIRGEMFSDGYGFVVDYLAEILRYLRNQDFSDRYMAHFTLSPDISTRDRDAVHKTFSGLMKVLYPSGKASTQDIEELLRFAVECRKRVKDQLLRIDTTYPEVDFSYQTSDGRNIPVTTLEEVEYPTHYQWRPSIERPKAAAAAGQPSGSEPTESEPTGSEPTESGPMEPESTPQAGAQPPRPIIGLRKPSNTEIAAPNSLDSGKPRAEPISPSGPKPGHRTFSENQKGVTFDDLFWPWLQGASRIVLTDPYIRLFHQVRNLLEFIDMIARQKAPEDEVHLHLVTGPDEWNHEKQVGNLEAVQEGALAAGIQFDWEFDNSGVIHARHIVTDTGWKISLDRGLDIFQKFDLNDTFSLKTRLQQLRPVKGFELTYLRYYE
jgi:ATP-dependent Lon protease